MTQLALLAMTRQACLNAHFVSRTLRTMGFEPRIIPALYVKPFRKGKKNDFSIMMPKLLPRRPCDQSLSPVVGGQTAALTSAAS